MSVVSTVGCAFLFVLLQDVCGRGLTATAQPGAGGQALSFWAGRLVGGCWVAGLTAGIVTAGETLVLGLPGSPIEGIAEVAGDGRGQLLPVIVGVGLTGTENPGLSIGCGAD